MGLRIDVREMRRSFERKRNQISAQAFRPELKRFAQRALTAAIKTTPVRSLATITAAQTRQYEHRINYIPSYHGRHDPALIVNEAGESWLYAEGRWWAASYRTLPDNIAAILGDLESERDRRMNTPRARFIADRTQARFLYRRSWWQVGVSLGIPLQVDAGVEESHSRHNPAKAPAKGYGQWRGGKHVLSIIIWNVFLDIESRYKPFSGKAIMQTAIDTHQATFMGEVNAKVVAMLRTV